MANLHFAELLPAKNKGGYSNWSKRFTAVEKGKVGKRIGSHVAGSNSLGKYHHP